MEGIIDYAVQKLFSKWRTKKAIKPAAEKPRIELDIFIEDSSNSSVNTLAWALRIQKITPKQTETKNHDSTKFVKLQLEY